MSSTPSRCGWALTGGPQIGDAYLRYHDEVWGVPERDPHTLFEFLILEGAQAGLSWSTILRKLDGYRSAYDGFDPAVIARYGDDDVARLLADEGIVRNRAKVAASIRNAQAWLDLDDPVAYLWGFTDGDVIQNAWPDMAALPAETERSQAMSRDLKRRGFTFVGPTICYAFMQATGMVNDHVVSCFRHAECRALA
ncbi:MAG TPA: DNA-3-methyladenine glycosylase I [Ilumatobacteraceae bacterium]|nr:DNA-3-methyladenine glycosylase I [Ilumatobacteraceae bacterium]